MSDWFDFNGDGIADGRDVAEMDYDEYYWSRQAAQDSGQGGSGARADGTGRNNVPVSHTVSRGTGAARRHGIFGDIVVALFVFSLVIFALAGVYWIYSTVSEFVWSRQEQKAKEAYFSYVQTMEHEITSINDYIIGVNLEVDYGYKDSGVQYDYITINITLNDSLEDSSFLGKAGVLYAIDSGIIEKLLAAQEETGYDRVLDHDGSTYNHISIEFHTSDYFYYFKTKYSSISDVGSRSYRTLSTIDRSRQYNFQGYAEYRLTWEDGTIQSVRKLD